MPQWTNRLRLSRSTGSKESGARYPKIAQSWRANWAGLSTYCKYPAEIWRIIYTTKKIEGFNRQLRKVTKSKGVFPTDDSLLKMQYLAEIDITKKWTGRRQDWGVIHSQLEIFLRFGSPARGTGKVEPDPVKGK